MASSADARLLHRYSNWKSDSFVALVQDEAH